MYANSPHSARRERSETSPASSPRGSIDTTRPVDSNGQPVLTPSQRFAGTSTMDYAAPFTSSGDSRRTSTSQSPSRRQPSSPLASQPSTIPAPLRSSKALPAIDTTVQSASTASAQSGREYGMLAGGFESPQRSPVVPRTNTSPARAGEGRRSDTGHTMQGSPLAPRPDRGAQQMPSTPPRRAPSSTFASPGSDRATFASPSFYPVNRDLSLDGLAELAKRDGNPRSEQGTLSFGVDEGEAWKRTLGGYRERPLPEPRALDEREKLRQGKVEYVVPKARRDSLTAVQAGEWRDAHKPTMHEEQDYRRMRVESIPTQVLLSPDRNSAQETMAERTITPRKSNESARASRSSPITPQSAAQQVARDNFAPLAAAPHSVAPLPTKVDSSIATPFDFGDADQGLPTPPSSHVSRTGSLSEPGLLHVPVELEQPSAERSDSLLAPTPVDLSVSTPDLLSAEVAHHSVMDRPPPKLVKRNIFTLFEIAISEHPTTILVRLLRHIDHNTLRSLRKTSKLIMHELEVESRELVLQRFLGMYGYRTLATMRTSPRLDGEVAHDDQRGRSLRGELVATSRVMDDIIELDLRDLDAFYLGMQYSVRDFARFARAHSSNALPVNTLCMIRASTRSWNRIVLRIRLQEVLGPGHYAIEARPRYEFSSLASSVTPIHKLGRAPILRVWVPTIKGSWMTDEEVVESEREVWRSGVWTHMRRGDIVHNVAMGDFGNEGKLISDGKFLRDLQHIYDFVGHLPSWLDMLTLSPSYYHNLITSSSPQGNPVCHLSLLACLPQIRDTLQLCQEKVTLTSPQGEYVVKRFVYRSTVQIRPGMICGTEGGRKGQGPGGLEVVHPDWTGLLVLETDGTAEHAASLIARCSGPHPTPWRILREKSRAGKIWLTPVTDAERIH